MTKKRIAVWSITTIVLLLTPIAVLVLHSRQDATDLDPQSVLSDAATQEPSFEVLQPDDQSDNEIFFDPEEGVASYSGTIDGVDIAITQQPLTTEQLNDDSDWLKEIALSIEADTVFQSKYGDTYLAEPSELTGNAQAVVFKTEQLLITIRTNGDKISLLSWAEFIESISN